MNPDKKSISITLPLTPDQFEWLERTARFISDETLCEVSHASIMMRLMENGLPAFEKEIERLRSQNNKAKQRFHKLQLVYTRIE